MIDAQNQKYVMMVVNTSVTAAATVTGTVDTLGYNHLQVFVTGDTASSAMTTLKLSNGTDTNASTDIAAFTAGDTTDGFTMAAADTDNGVSTLMDVSLTPRERWIKVTITPAATQLVSATAVLSRAEDSPVSATEVGVDVYQLG